MPNSTAGAGTGSESSKITKNNAVDKTTENTTIPAGTVQRQSLSVAIDTKAAAKIDAATLTDMVATAAGINTQRGDRVTLKVVPFSTSQADAAKAALDAAKAEANAAATAQTWKTLTIGALALLVLLAAVILYARKNRRQVREIVDLGEQSGPVVNIDPLPLDPSPRTAALPSIPAPVELPVAEATDSDAKRASLEALAESDPAKTAGLLRSLMDDRVGV